MGALLFSFQGRVRRTDYWWAVLLVLSAFTTLWIGMQASFGRASTWALYPPLYWSLTALSITRYHDLGRSGWRLLWVLVPVLGPLWVLWSVAIRRGARATNRYGPSPDGNLDYLVVGSTATGTPVVNDVTGLNPIPVRQILRPTSVEEIEQALRGSSGPVSIGGGCFSMGGQTASADSLHIDMRSVNQITGFSRDERWIRVQAGARWADLQRFLDPHGLAVKIMQTYANFTVGGSLSVNSHGRYVGLGPVILSVRAIVLVLADGRRQSASPSERPDLFYGAIGGYGGLGVIVEAELDVADNRRVTCESIKLPAADYLAYFRSTVRERPAAVFHNADVYPPHYTHLRAQTWIETDAAPTDKSRLMPLRDSFPLERYVFWAISETPWGTWRREHVFDPLVWFRPHVRWRNYEAGYDVAELGLAPRPQVRYVLQEYFVAIDRVNDFLPRMAEILRRHRVNVVNVSIRHAIADPGSILAWAREEVFAFVIYYKQRVRPHDQHRVAVWTRELIEAAIAAGGTYYLPYQASATPDQFHRAYPRARDFFALKRALDPDFRFRNVLWNQYYAPTTQETTMAAPSVRGSEFRQVFGDTVWSDRFYLFLQNIFHLYPEDRFHALIKATSAQYATDREIYGQVQAGLPAIKPWLAPLTHALPALRKQKREMTRQTLALLGERRTCDGYVEIGSTGRYISELRKHVRVTGPVYLTNDVAPGNGLADLMERGGFRQLGTFLPLDYRPLDEKGIAAGSVDLVTSFIGLHHAPTDLLDGFVRSIHRILRPGGLFIVRDHDAHSPDMKVFVSLVHTVFNLGLDVTWEANDAEFKSFASVEDWSRYLVARGFRDLGARVLQDHDPSANTLMGFVKTDEGAAR